MTSVSDDDLEEYLDPNGDPLPPPNLDEFDNSCATRTPDASVQRVIADPSVLIEFVTQTQEQPTTDIPQTSLAENDVLDTNERENENSIGNQSTNDDDDDNIVIMRKRTRSNSTLEHQTSSTPPMACQDSSTDSSVEREISHSIKRGRGRLKRHLRRPSPQSESSEFESSEDELEEVTVVLRRSKRIKGIPAEEEEEEEEHGEQEDENHDDSEVQEVEVTPQRQVRVCLSDSDESAPRSSQAAPAEIQADIASDKPSVTDWSNVRPTKRKRSSTDSYESPILRRRKRDRTRTPKNRTSIEISSDDEEVLRSRPRKQRRLRTRTPRGKTIGYELDGFVVSDNSEVDDSSSTAGAGDPDDDDNDDDVDDNDEESESGDEFTDIPDSIRRAMKRELGGKRIPFRNAFMCFICKWTGLPAIGNPSNGYRDGFIQPVANFSQNVLRGNYGVRMREPFCLSHTAGDQNRYVARLHATAERNKSAMASESESESQEQKQQGNGQIQIIISDDDDDDDDVYDDSSPPQSNPDHGRKENVELSVEKVVLSVDRREYKEAVMFGAEYDWDLEEYVAMPGTNLVPLKKWIVQEP